MKLLLQSEMSLLSGERDRERDPIDNRPDDIPR